MAQQKEQGYIRYIQVVKDHDAIAYIPTYAGTGASIAVYRWEIAGLSRQCLFGYHWNMPTQNTGEKCIAVKVELTC